MIASRIIIFNAYCGHDMHPLSKIEAIIKNDKALLLVVTALMYYLKWIMSMFMLIKAIVRFV